MQTKQEQERRIKKLLVQLVKQIALLMAYTAIATLCLAAWCFIIVRFFL